MAIYEYGNSDAPVVLIQPADAHDLSEMNDETAEIKRLTEQPFRLLCASVDDWNRDLSPWEAPAVFGSVGFGGRAGETLAAILKLCTDPDKRYFLGGYSLAGLFALWAGLQTDVFSGIAAASPSVWFPGFVEYLQTHKMQSPQVYLSLGDREAKTRNQTMARVADCIVQCETILTAQGKICTLEWNPGNHFKDPGLRTAKAFAWLLNHIGEDGK